MNFTNPVGGFGSIFRKKRVVKAGNGGIATPYVPPAQSAPFSPASDSLLGVAPVARNDFAAGESFVPPGATTSGKNKILFIAGGVALFAVAAFLILRKRR
jgi:LPXTG-motif cell wall-anchored protein